MVRKLRVEYPGAIYQVMNRGDRREPIFKEAGNPAQRAKGERDIVALVARSRQERTLTARWIAGRRQMGIPGHEPPAVSAPKKRRRTPPEVIICKYQELTP
jgi:hypothetical protein